jgi:hypothetical protein
VRTSVLMKMLFFQLIFESSVGIITPLWGHYVFQIHGNLKTAGIAIACFMFACSFSVLPVSYVIKRAQHFRFFLATPSLLYAVFSVAYFFVTRSFELYILQVFLGFFAAVNIAVFDPLFDMAMDDGHESFAWGGYAMMYGCAVALGALIGSHLAYYVSYYAVFGSIIGVALLSFFVALFVPLKVVEAAS